MNKLDDIVAALKDKLQDEAEGLANINDWFDAGIGTPSTNICCHYQKGKECEVFVEHKGNDHYSENVEEYLVAQLQGCVDWDDVRRKWYEYNCEP